MKTRETVPGIRKNPSPAADRESKPVSRRQIMLVDDHPLMLAGLAQLINRQPDLAVCAEAGDPAAASRELGRTRADLILTDITMPGRGGFEFIRDLIAANPAQLILVVSMHDEVIYAERALRAGARGYVMKEAGGENLLAAIRQVLAGQVYLSVRMSARVLEDLSARRPRGSASPIESLTDREFEVFQLVGLGRSTRDIASQLRLSPKTVDVHRGHIKVKLQLGDSTALVRYAVRWVETQT
ncbi:MAG TPA: response regulator transcription factor [Opitutaceae bacterium]|nr:response regulator transcription factor [Opitutaceae bacterium]